MCLSKLINVQCIYIHQRFEYKSKNRTKNQLSLNQINSEPLSLALNDLMEGDNLLSEWSLFYASVPRKGNDL